MAPHVRFKNLELEHPHFHTVSQLCHLQRPFAVLPDLYEQAEHVVSTSLHYNNNNNNNYTLFLEDPSVETIICPQWRWDTLLTAKLVIVVEIFSIFYFLLTNLDCMWLYLKIFTENLVLRFCFAHTTFARLWIKHLNGDHMELVDLQISEFIEGWDFPEGQSQNRWR